MVITEEQVKHLNTVVLQYKYIQKMQTERQTG